MGKIAYVFPGQGAQKAGMGRDFCESSAASGKVFDMASELLSLDMRELCFTENDRLDMTEYTQAAMVTVGLAMMAEMEYRGIKKPDVTAGMSLGEYCAMAAAGVMSYETVIRTVRKRGILMQEAVPAGEGGMSAVLAMSPEKIQEVLDEFEDVQIANYNCSGQVVISGRMSSLEAAEAALKAAGARRVVRLNVSGPFHSLMMRPAAAALRRELDKTELREHEIPYVANVTAEYVRGTENVRELLERQIYSPVKWQQSIEVMMADGVDTYVEIGPGKTTTALIKKIHRGAAVYNVERPEDLAALRDL